MTTRVDERGFVEEDGLSEEQKYAVEAVIKRVVDEHLNPKAEAPAPVSEDERAAAAYAEGRAAGMRDAQQRLHPPLRRDVRPNLSEYERWLLESRRASEDLGMPAKPFLRLRPLDAFTSGALEPAEEMKFVGLFSPAYYSGIPVDMAARGKERDKIQAQYDKVDAERLKWQRQLTQAKGKLDTVQSRRNALSADEFEKHGDDLLNDEADVVSTIHHCENMVSRLERDLDQIRSSAESLSELKLSAPARGYGKLLKQTCEWLESYAKTMQYRGLLMECLDYRLQTDAYDTGERLALLMGVMRECGVNENEMRQWHSQETMDGAGSRFLTKAELAALGAPGRVNPGGWKFTAINTELEQLAKNRKASKPKNQPALLRILRFDDFVERYSELVGHYGKSLQLGQMATPERREYVTGPDGQPYLGPLVK